MDRFNNLYPCFISRISREEDLEMTGRWIVEGLCQFEKGYGLDMIGLREHIKCNKAFYFIMAGDELLQITSQSHRVAGDIADLRRLEFGDQVKGFNGPASGRVKQHQVGRWELLTGEIFQPAINSTTVNGGVFRFIEGNIFIGKI